MVQTLSTIALAALLGLVSVPTNALEPIKLQLRWTHQFQFAGYYVAKEQGYFADAGFDVELLPGGPN